MIILDAVVLFHRFAPQLHWAAGAYAWSITSDLSWHKRCSGFVDKPSPISSPSVIGSPVRSAKYIRSPMSYHRDLEEDAEVTVSRTGEADCERSPR